MLNQLKAWESKIKKNETVDIDKQNWPAESHKSIDGSTVYMYLQYMYDWSFKYQTFIFQNALFQTDHSNKDYKSNKGHTRDKRSDDSHVIRKIKNSAVYYKVCGWTSFVGRITTTKYIYMYIV